MKRDTSKVRAKRFSDALKACVESTYCLGGASEDEIKAATADFLMSVAHMFISQISTDVEVPTIR